MQNNHWEQEMSGSDSMHLIEQMIGAAKEQHGENGSGWIVWGWILFLASVGSVLLSFLHLPVYIGWLWTAVLPVGLLVYFFSRSRRKNEPVVTYVSELLHRIEIGFFISLVVMIGGSNIIGNHHHQYAHYLFGFYFVLYAFWMYIHGSVTRFRPLVIGAFFNWAAAVVIFFLKDFAYIMVVSAVAVLIGYIIPGYIQLHQYKKAKGE